MECYGKSFGRKDACADCELAPWCKDAGDPPLSGDVNIDDLPIASRHSSVSDEDEEPLRYTRSQMLQLIMLLIDLDDQRIREIVRMKMSDPDISLSQIGAKYNISKQAIKKDVDLAIAYCPALKDVLCNRPLYNRWRSRHHSFRSAFSRRCKNKSLDKAVQLTFPF